MCCGLTLNNYLGVHSLTGCRLPKWYQQWLGADHPSVTKLMYTDYQGCILITQGCTYQWHKCTDWIPSNPVLPNNNYKISLSTTHRLTGCFHNPLACTSCRSLHPILLPTHKTLAHSHTHRPWHTRVYFKRTRFIRTGSLTLGMCYDWLSYLAHKYCSLGCTHHIFHKMGSYDQ